MKKTAAEVIKFGQNVFTVSLFEYLQNCHVKWIYGGRLKINGRYQKRWN